MLCDVVEGRAVLIGPEGDEVITLNRVGSLVWDWLATPATADQLTDQLLGRVPGLDRATAARDVGSFLGELHSARLAAED